MVTQSTEPLNGSSSLHSFFGAPFVRNGQRAGRGQYFQVTVPSDGATVTQGHTLGRVPTMFLMLDSGNNATPSYVFPTSGRTTTQFTFTCGAAGTYLLWVN